MYRWNLVTGYILLFILASPILLSAQNGYIKFTKDSIRYGYIKHYTAYSDGERGLELWRDKNDKDPFRIPTNSIYEYAIKKDTVRVLVQFQPFPDDPDIFYPLVEARLLSRGSVNLYVMGYQNPHSVSTYTAGGLIPAIIDQSTGQTQVLYILEEPDTNYLRALPFKQEELIDMLNDFFPPKYVSAYIKRKTKGKIKYKKIPDLVKIYNDHS